jgi:hypothetical protein
MKHSLRVVVAEREIEMGRWHRATCETLLKSCSRSHSRRPGTASQLTVACPRIPVSCLDLILDRRRFNAHEKFVAVHRFQKEGGRARSHCLGTNGRIVFAGQDNDAAQRRHCFEARLYFKAVQYRHPDVEYHDAGMLSLRVMQEGNRIRERFNFPARRGKKPARRFQHGQIIVEQANS